MNADHACAAQVVHASRASVQCCRIAGLPLRSSKSCRYPRAPRNSLRLRRACAWRITPAAASGSSSIGCGPSAMAAMWRAPTCGQKSVAGQEQDWSMHARGQPTCKERRRTGPGGDAARSSLGLSCSQHARKQPRGAPYCLSQAQATSSQPPLLSDPLGLASSPTPGAHQSAASMAYLVQPVVGPQAQVVWPRLHHPHAAAVATLQVAQQQRGQAVVGVACRRAGEDTRGASRC